MVENERQARELSKGKSVSWPELSDSEVARICAVSHPFVGEVRRELVTVTGSPSSPTRVGADGKRLSCVGELVIKLKSLIADNAEKNLHMSKGRGKKGSATLSKVNPVDTRKELSKVSGISHDTLAKVEF